MTVLKETLRLVNSNPHPTPLIEKIKEPEYRARCDETENGSLGPFSPEPHSPVPATNSDLNPDSRVQIPEGSNNLAQGSLDLNLTLYSWTGVRVENIVMEIESLGPHLYTPVLPMGQSSHSKDETAQRREMAFLLSYRKTVTDTG